MRGLEVSIDVRGGALELAERTGQRGFHCGHGYGTNVGRLFKITAPALSDENAGALPWLKSKDVSDLGDHEKPESPFIRRARRVRCSSMANSRTRMMNV